MKINIKTGLIISLIVFLQPQSMVRAENWFDPNALFDASKLMTDKVVIKWVRVKDIRATCESESRKRGFKGFGFSMEACSFWGKTLVGGNYCDVFTRERTTLHDIGHEMRHCFQGDFH